MALTASRQGLWRARPAGQARVRRQKLTRALNIAACIVCVVACAACTCPALTCNHVSCGVVFWASLWLCHVEYRPLAPRGIPVWVVTLVQGSFSLDRTFRLPRSVLSVVHISCCPVDPRPRSGLTGYSVRPVKLTQDTLCRSTTTHHAHRRRVERHLPRRPCRSLRSAREISVVLGRSRSNLFL